MSWYWPIWRYSPMMMIIWQRKLQCNQSHNLHLIKTDLLFIMKEGWLNIFIFLSLLRIIYFFKLRRNRGRWVFSFLFCKLCKRKKYLKSLFTIFPLFQCWILESSVFYHCLAVVVWLDTFTNGNNEETVLCNLIFTLIEQSEQWRLINNKIETDFVS